MYVDSGRVGGIRRSDRLWVTVILTHQIDRRVRATLGGSGFALDLGGDRRE